MTRVTFKNELNSIAEAVEFFEAVEQELAADVLGREELRFEAELDAELFFARFIVVDPVDEVEEIRTELYAIAELIGVELRVENESVTFD